jgi:hypothetical protein
MSMTDDELLDAFMSWPRADSRFVSKYFLPPGVAADDLTSMLAEPWNARGATTWQLTRVQARDGALDGFNAVLPGSLPPLYLRLVCRFHFGEAEFSESGLPSLRRVRLLPNFPPALDGLMAAMQRDPMMWCVLTSHGYVEFGKGAEPSYDAICFDLNRRLPDGDCPVVRLDHEEILVRERIQVRWDVADSFRGLVESIVAVPPPGRVDED